MDKIELQGNFTLVRKKQRKIHLNINSYIFDFKNQKFCNKNNYLSVSIKKLLAKNFNSIMYYNHDFTCRLNIFPISHNYKSGFLNNIESNSSDLIRNSNRSSLNIDIRNNIYIYNKKTIF